MQKITQNSDQWYKHVANGNVDIENVQISDGGLLMIDGIPNGSDVVTLKNVSNKNSTGNAKYFLMCWPTSPHLIPKLVWDNSGALGPVIQGPNEAAARFKVSDGYVHKVIFKGHLVNGNPWKQVAQVRSVDKQFVFDGCDFVDSWCDIGQQKIAQPDGSSIWDTDQHVKLVIFENCTFHRLPGPHSYVSRQPGVDKIEFINCFDDHGKKFSKTI